MMSHIQTLNAASLWDKLTNGPATPDQGTAPGAVYSAKA